ncbi:unnamed protein product [Lampetra planeri]
MEIAALDREPGRPGLAPGLIPRVPARNSPIDDSAAASPSLPVAWMGGDGSGPSSRSLHHPARDARSNPQLQAAPLSLPETPCVALHPWARPGPACTTMEHLRWPCGPRCDPRGGESNHVRAEYPQFEMSRYLRSVT